MLGPAGVQPDPAVMRASVAMLPADPAHGCCKAFLTCATTARFEARLRGGLDAGPRECEGSRQSRRCPSSAGLIPNWHGPMRYCCRQHKPPSLTVIAGTHQQGPQGHAMSMLRLHPSTFSPDTSGLLGARTTSLAWPYQAVSVLRSLHITSSCHTSGHRALATSRIDDYVFALTSGTGP